MTLHGGWYLLAFAEEIGAQPTPLDIGGRPLVAIRQEDRIRVFDGTCPHRGAHLGHGGQLARNALVCPFHGKRIALGDPSCHWYVEEHRVVTAGPLVFLRLANGEDDRGFERAIKAVAADHVIVGAFVQPVRVPAEYVVENAFDPDHFAAVHGIRRVAGRGLALGPDGELSIDLEFRTKAPPWAAEITADYATAFTARAYSPHVVVSELASPDGRHVVITGANPAPEGCVARIAFAVDPDQQAALPPLITGGRKAFGQDIAVWEHLNLAAPARYDNRDEPVRAFRRFCAGFESVTG
jgi:nitrite reductase/ring-hydroxylating ferredoxin subunit